MIHCYLEGDELIVNECKKAMTAMEAKKAENPDYYKLQENNSKRLYNDEVVLKMTQSKVKEHQLENLFTIKEP